MADVDHRNQPLVEDVRIQLVGVSVEVGDVEIRAVPNWAIQPAPPCRETERKKCFMLLILSLRYDFKTRNHSQKLHQLGNTQHAHNQATAAAARLSTTPTRTMVAMRRRPPNTIALGGVAIGSMNAQLLAIVTGTTRAADACPTTMRFGPPGP